MTNKQRINQQRQDFLLTFFDNKVKYQEKEVNGFWLVKQVNGNTGKCLVAIYPKGHFRKSEKFNF